MQLGWTLDKRYRETKKPTTTLEEPGAKTGCQEQKQGTEHTLCPQHLSHPSSRTSGHIPTLTPNKEQACPLPRGANKQGNLLFILAPPCYSRGPSKAMPGKKKGLQKRFKILQLSWFATRWWSCRCVTESHQKEGSSVVDQLPWY